MGYAITTTLSKPTITFVAEWAKQCNINKNEVIEEALQLYKKVCTKEQIKRWWEDRGDEYRQINKEFASAQFNSLTKK